MELFIYLNFIIEKNQNKVLSSIQNPDDCILAKSQCNTCNRDKTEIIIYQGLNLLIDDKTIFEDTLQFINLIEPNSEDIILNNKDKHDIYCSYQKLPLIVKKEFPLKFIYDIVLDTQKRKTVFYGSLKNTTNNYRKEECY